MGYDKVVCVCCYDDIQVMRYIEDGICIILLMIHKIKYYTYDEINIRLYIHDEIYTRA